MTTTHNYCPARPIGHSGLKVPTTIDFYESLELRTTGTHFRSWWMREAYVLSVSRENIV